ncbi:hypothetical protein BD414DRAFT_485825 [Trametes punicea]|nr:hypothetical protein BD414DRAFT_485825 [Trametes punicea]
MVHNSEAGPAWCFLNSSDKPLSHPVYSSAERVRRRLRNWSGSFASYLRGNRLQLQASQVTGDGSSVRRCIVRVGRKPLKLVERCERADPPYFSMLLVLREAAICWSSARVGAITEHIVPCDSRVSRRVVQAAELHMTFYLQSFTEQATSLANPTRSTSPDLVAPVDAPPKPDGLLVWFYNHNNS